MESLIILNQINIKIIKKKLIMMIKINQMIIKMIKIKTKFYMNLKNKIFNSKNKLKLEKLKESHQYSYFLPFILSKVGGNISEESDSIIRYAFSMFTLNLIVLICFINVFGYILSLYLISKYDIETKFPKLKRIIKYYEKSTQFFIIIEVLIGFIFLIVIIIMNLILCGVIILK
jgi:hypothetical protein